jgi:ketosteroid isomerase-like protein
MTSIASAADARSAIEAANRTFMNAFGRGDAVTLAGLYSATAQLLPAHSDFVAGSMAIRHFWQGVMELGVTRALLETLEIETQGDIACETGRYTLRAGEEIADVGKYLVLWKRDGAAWKLHRDIWTTSRPVA